ncbi:alpha/beta fold hydrolase [Neorhizobium galegae]|uniref:Sigma factor sigB regulation protein RsbQ n=1 Tax=Neorhizobium galegae bv. orientalis str. HAMBI 540 TaxID=1028800 RepID=A0A068T1P2_NEOGA|nr:alpha/beta hydrolase [Neorhizobium galegae]CDN51390.1 Sigma factor sigB regulation protein RsbQ [Neorhizobium galegae bv. orientalis str. HAMBI 540]CDZ49702.1 2-hydroxy-6-phenylhexa-2,4-dienoic acid hydrolase [Neorhizobium galegae bv. orientalis]
MNNLHLLDAPFGGQVGYRTLGTAGDWLVLIHGWCGSAGHWDIIGPELARDFRVLVLSHPGFGGTAPPPASGQTITAMGAAVALVLGHLDISGAILVGHSMGGPISTETAITAPQRVAAVIGLDTLSDRDYYGRVPDEEIRRRHEEFQMDYPARMRAMVDMIVHPTTAEAVRAQINDGMLAAAPGDFALDIKDDLFAWNAEDRWPLVTCPKMLLNSPYVARLAHPDPMPCFAATPIATYDSGHFPMVEAPSMIVDKIRSCIASLVY